MCLLTYLKPVITCMREVITLSPFGIDQATYLEFIIQGIFKVLLLRCSYFKQHHETEGANFLYLVGAA